MAVTFQRTGRQRQRELRESFIYIEHQVSIHFYHLSWLYTLYLAMDANFRLKLRERHIKNDPELGPGWAYCVDEKPYQEEMVKYGDQTEVCIIISVDRIL
jgi:hypothetical protein